VRRNGWLTNALVEPAGEIERLGQAYAAELVKLDPAVLTLIDAVAAADVTELDEAEEFFESIQGLTGSAGETIDQLDLFVSSMDDVARLSRGLRKPLRQMKSGLRGVIDGRALMDEWDRRIAGVSQNFDELESQRRREDEPVQKHSASADESGAEAHEDDGPDPAEPATGAV